MLNGQRRAAASSSCAPRRAERAAWPGSGPVRAAGTRDAAAAPPAAAAALRRLGAARPLARAGAPLPPAAARRVLMPAAPRGRRARSPPSPPTARIRSCPPAGAVPRAPVSEPARVASPGRLRRCWGESPPLTFGQSGKTPRLPWYVSRAVCRGRRRAWQQLGC